MDGQNDKSYRSIIAHYEQCLDKYGDSHLGVDWPKQEDADKRYRIMLDFILMVGTVKAPYTLLDFGCGTGHLYEYIQKNGVEHFDYAGIDISAKFIDVCKVKFPNISFTVLDVLEEPDKLSSYDIVVLNGVFTEKQNLTFDQMWEYFKSMIKLIFSKAKVGIAFNVMSKQVEWERDDLFHLPHDLLASFLCTDVTRNYVVRNDYGLYEYTVYLYK